MTTTGIWVQTTDPYLDLFLETADYWTRADDQIYVYRDDESDNPVAEVADEYFVSAAETSEESLADHPTTADDTEVSP